MTLDSFVRRLLRWLYYEHQWEEWEVLMIAIPALVLLLLIMRRQRKAAAVITHADHILERSPIIGVKLKRRGEEIDDLKEGRPARAQTRREKKEKLKQATEWLERLNDRIGQLQTEIIKRSQTEESLNQNVAELTAANEQLRHKIAEGKQAEGCLEQKALEPAAICERLKRKIAEHTQANGQHEHTVGDHNRTVERVEQQTSKPLFTSEQPQQRLGEYRQTDGTPGDGAQQAKKTRRQSEPLDVEKLQAIAALAKQIQRRPHRA
jgi:chromosome segregation ATPase